MTICQFFLRGQYQSWGGSMAPGTTQSNTPMQASFTLESVTRDLTPQQDKPMWPLSSYGAAKWEVNVIGDQDESPEELRVKAVIALNFGNVAEYQQYEDEKVAAVEQLYGNALANVNLVYQKACDLAVGPSNDPGRKPTFGGLTSAFGSNTAESAFGKPSAFGAIDGTTSAFDTGVSAFSSEDTFLSEYSIQRRDLDAEKLKEIFGRYYFLPIHKFEGYTDVKCCGHGGFSIVYRATLPGTTTLVSVKVVNGRGSQEPWKPYLRVLREVKAWWGLKHDNILPLEGYCFDFLGNDIPAMIAPWCKNGNLREYLEKNDITPNHKLTLVIEVARGLDFLHDHQPCIIHGDIKPENILVDDDDHDARLCDLGIAKVMDENTGLTTGLHFTPKYKAPELAQSVRIPTKYSDIWALGCIFLTAVIGEELYFKLSPNGIMAALREGGSPEKHLSGKISIANDHLRFMRRCWKIVPHQRASTSEAIDTLEGFMMPFRQRN